MVAEIRANRNALDSPIDDSAFRRLVENIPTLCWIADADGYVFWYNQRWYDYTGTTAADMAGWGWQAVHDAKDLPDILDRWKAAISAAQPFEMVIRIKGKDGIYRPFMTRINPTFGDDGAVSNWFGVNTDISLQVQAEDAFAQSEARFRILADSMPQMVWSAAPNGLHDYHNARWYDYTGAPIGSCDGEDWIRLLHAEDQARVLAHWRLAVSGSGPYRIEHRLRSRSGAYRWVLARAQPEKDAKGAIIRWYGTCTDIEDIVQARAVLQRSRDDLEREVAARTGERNLLATLVETTDLMVMAIDLDHTILAVNKANADEFERVYGVRPRIGDNVLALLDGQPKNQAAIREGWRLGLSGEDVTIVEARGDPAISRSHYEIKFRALRDEAGVKIGAFQFVQDITQRVRDQAMLSQAQEALLQSKKLEAMGQLTGGVAHDFNNLLTPIIGSLDILQRRGFGGEREKRLIHGAYQSAERAKVLVHRLLAFARRQPLQAVAVDVVALVHGLTELVSSTIGPQIALILETADEPGWAMADAHQLEMAILNLCVNARDAMDGVGALTIGVEIETIETIEPRPSPPLTPGRYVRLSVTDNGAGMDEATLARAIEPFFSTKGIGKGTGLGLSMAHGLASQLGGALTIKSAPGEGAEISIWLPECESSVQRDGDPRQATARSARAGVALLVDDEEYIRLSTTDMLNDLGFTVHEAVSAEAALSALEQGLTPELLISDHLMPGMTGVELARAVKARAPDTKILIVSGFAEADGIDPALPRLTKPFVQSDLAEAITALRVHPRDSVDGAPDERSS